VATLHLVGGEKGGVGKSLVARILAQYFIDHSIAFLGFDSDRSHGALLRFYAGYASPVLIDHYESLDAIVEAATENPERRVLVDLAAQTQKSLTSWMDESQLLEVAPELGLDIRYWHVMDNGKDSVDLLQRLLDKYGKRLHYVIAQNQLRGEDFSILRQSGQLERAQGWGADTVLIARAQEATLNKIDATSTSFWAASQPEDRGGARLGVLERQRLRSWLKNAYDEITKVNP
jgi:hypothetical protein